MCFTLLIATSACQHNHIRDAVSCWRRCDLQTGTGPDDLCAESVARMDELRIRWVKSHAKRTIVRPYSEDCPVCTGLEEHVLLNWADSRDRMLRRRAELADVERMCNELDDADEDLDLEGARAAYEESKVAFQWECERNMNREIAMAAEEAFMAREERNLRPGHDRFFVGTMLWYDDEDKFEDFGMGEFDWGLIQSFGGGSGSE